MLRYFVIIIVLFFSLTSCIPHKKIVLFQKVEGFNNDSIVHYKYTYKIQSGDILGIAVTSFNDQTTDFFNLKSKDLINGYTVNSRGYIYIPMLDSLQVTGLTLAEVEKNVQDKIKEHVVDPYVVVKLLNFKFTALGEVGSAGIITTTEDELTLIEALGLVGDIGEMGNRKKVNLIRQEGQSSKFITLDLTRRDIVASEYFYLQPNDVIYVEPLRIKTFRTNLSQVSLYFSIVSISFLIYNIIRSTTR